MLEECIKVTGNHDNKKPNFVITDTKLYVAVVTLSVQNNAKLLQHLKTGFKGTVNWNKYQSESTLLTRIRYLNYLIHGSFQGVNVLFVSSFENHEHWISYKQYFILIVEIENYNFMTDGKTFLINQ